MTYSIKLWSEILQIINGKNQKAVEDPNGPYPIYGSGGTIGFARDYLCEAGTTIIGRKGTINNPIFVTERFWNVDTAFGLVPGDMLHPKYLYYFCVMFNFKELDKSTTIPSLAKRDLLNIKMPVPSLPEQERIVANIEELFSELDKAVETLRTTKQQLAVYRQAVLKEAFEKVKTYISFGEIIDARLGKMLDKEKNTGSYKKYLRNINVRWFSFDISDLLEMRIENQEVDKYSVRYGDLVICEGGEPGRCAVWEKENTIFYQKALHRVRFLDNSNPKFYMYYLWFCTQTGQLCKYFTGTGIKHLTGQSLAKVPVPSADRAIQNSVVSQIESRLSVCDSIEQTVDATLQQADALRQSILKEAFERRF
ncbi:MAG: restriction endonuclease subunit S [Ruminococcus flavefaciens]|nr:restriction endonuclease subunit S [Ruminococcus flavefaciens]